MNKLRLLQGAAIVGLVAGLAGGAQAIPTGWTCSGNCGTLGPDGVVTAPPAFGPNYEYISTSGAPGASTNGSSLGVGSETNGSLLTSNTFGAAAGDTLSFYFNFVTTDGAGFSDYAWAGLYDTSSMTTAILFTARTTPSGDTVPGFGLPGLAPGVTLNPSSTPIIPGAPTWSPVGSGCFSSGCGYTGWIEMDYTIPTGGTFQLRFGVVNSIDTIFDTGMAIAGATINDRPITEVPAPMSLALFGLGLAGLGAALRRKA
jgi:hypothetical protein